MIQQIPILNTIAGMLHRPDQRKQASLAIARLMSQFDLEAMPFELGVEPSRRDAQTRHVAIGLWLIPIGENQSLGDVSMKSAVPATTCDLRRNGFGVLTPAQLPAERFVVAVADLENTWKFFIAEARHKSERPGGWHQLGLSVQRIWEPNSLQSMQFRNRIAGLFATECVDRV